MSVLGLGCAAKPPPLAGAALYRSIQREEALLDQAAAAARSATRCDVRMTAEKKADEARRRLCGLASESQESDAHARCFRADDRVRAIVAEGRTHCDAKATP